MCFLFVPQGTFLDRISDKVATALFHNFYVFLNLFSTNNPTIQRQKKRAKFEAFL